MVNYEEADKVLADWKETADQAQKVSDSLPASERDAFNELVLYPAKACANLNALYVAAAKNHLYAAQGRAGANDAAADVKNLFQADAEMSDFYNHKLADGKWNHMMDQTHIGYTRWQQPDRNNLPSMADLTSPEEAQMGIAVEGVTNVWPQDSREAVLPAFDKFNQPSRFIDVFNQGKAPFQFSAVPSSTPWISLSASSGNVDKEQRLWVNVDWKNAPAGETNGMVNITSGTNSVSVRVNLVNPQEPSLDSFQGFIEADGYVSIEAEHFTGKVDANPARWEKIDGLGNTLSAMTLFPLTAASVTPPENSPCLEYKNVLVRCGQGAGGDQRIAPTLNFVARRGLRFALSFDDGPPARSSRLCPRITRWAAAISTATGG